MEMCSDVRRSAIPNSDAPSVVLAQQLAHIGCGVAVQACELVTSSMLMGNPASMAVRASRRQLGSYTTRQTKHFKYSPSRQVALVG
jgi:hypothetical protein